MDLVRPKPQFDPDPSRDRFPVACHHQNFGPARPQCQKRLTRRLAGGIGNSDRPQKSGTATDKNYRLCAFGHCAQGRGQACPHARQHPPVPGPNRALLVATGDAFAGEGLHRADLGWKDPPFGGLAPQGPGNRMFGLRLKPCGKGKEAILEPLQSKDPGHFGLPRGQRAGLVKGEGPHFRQSFQRCAALEQHAPPCCRGQRRQNRRRDRNHNGTGACRDQKCGRAVKRLVGRKPRLPEAEPGQDRARQDNDRIALAEPVRKPLGGRFHRLRLGHHADHLGDRAFVQPAGNFDRQDAMKVHCCFMHQGTRPLADRGRFPGDGAFVQMARTFDNPPVHRHPRSGAQDHPVAGDKIRDRHFFHALRPRAQRSFRTKLH